MTPGRWRAASSSLGAIVNAVTPTALRLAPSLLITDDEIDQALTLLAEVM